ncbi:MAG TPA: hypothetical protein DDZ58_00885 [Achromobacter sp.]|nr:hypothetical protein [Achromobacter sp.]
MDRLAVALRCDAMAGRWLGDGNCHGHHLSQSRAIGIAIGIAIATAASLAKSATRGSTATYAADSRTHQAYGWTDDD